MYISNPSRKEPVVFLRVLLLVLIAVTLYALQILHTASSQYQQIARTVASDPTVVATVKIGDKELEVPSYSLFKMSGVWALVSRDKLLKTEAGYDLTDIPVAHGDASQSMKVAKIITTPLQRLVNAAEADGESLMVSSSYRSLEGQRKIRDTFIAKYGETMAETYVLPVGASEHHTGLSVDFSSLSDACAKDSDSCSLSQSGAVWLSENAAKFGFILRYPDGKQAITGVGYEPWHYRYVGPPLAQAMVTTTLTFDEVVQKIAPGYASTR